MGRSRWSRFLRMLTSLVPVDKVLISVRRIFFAAWRSFELLRTNPATPFHTQDPTNKPTPPLPYHVRQPDTPPQGAPRIAHVIANFMTGGSSRLVVDLIEHLGSHYHQRVLTSYIPVPPAYTNLEIEECRFPDNEIPFIKYFQRINADIVHVHYWGDCDEHWYAKAISAATTLGLPIIENVNTPIAPHESESVTKYIYVSNYVREVFGHNSGNHITIYPGSDFSIFSEIRHIPSAIKWIGMVYRLERDKLDEDAITPFILAALRLPDVRVLIVGGGSLLDMYRSKVAEAGLLERFEFTGYVPYEQLPHYYARLCLFVAPVWKESFGQVSPFAMAMGVPVCGYAVGALEEITGDGTVLASPGDALGLANIIHSLLESDELRCIKADMQRERALALFSVQSMIEAYANVYASTPYVNNGSAT